jgi:dienelactone hydrolase
MANRTDICRLLTIAFTGVALMLAGCGSHAPARAHSAATHSSQPTKTSATTGLPAPGLRCPGPNMPATTLLFSSRSGARLDGALVGSGSIGAVLLSEYPGPYCGWWPYAVDLARHGVHVLLFDFHCQGLSACGHDPRDYVADADAAVAVLRAHGARSIALIGASLGGAIALAAAASQRPAALVDLSGEPNPAKIIPGLHLGPMQFAPHVHAPALFAVARGDRYVSANAMRAIYHAAGSPAKTLRVLPQSAGHGWDMLTGASGNFTALASQIITFVKAHQATSRQQPSNTS